jgi:hypothetical protein
MAGSPAGQPRWGARPVRLSAKRELAWEPINGRAERAAHAGGQGCPRSTLARHPD